MQNFEVLFTDNKTQIVKAKFVELVKEGDVSFLKFKDELGQYVAGFTVSTVKGYALKADEPKQPEKTPAK